MICSRSGLVLVSCLFQKDKKPEEVDLRGGGGAPLPILLQTRVLLKLRVFGAESELILRHFLGQHLDVCLLLSRGFTGFHEVLVLQNQMKENVTFLLP